MSTKLRGRGRGKLAGDLKRLLAHGTGDKIGGSQQGVAVAAKARKKLSKKDKATIEGRFATHLRALLDERDWQVGNLHERLLAAGMDIKKPAIHKWLRGAGMPDSRDLEKIGIALGLDDPRHVLPPLNQ